MPRLLRIGFAIVASGLVVDLGYHGFHAGGTGAELSGHLLSLAGMLVVIGGPSHHRGTRCRAPPERRSTP